MNDYVPIVSDDQMDWMAVETYTPEEIKAAFELIKEWHRDEYAYYVNLMDALRANRKSAMEAQPAVTTNISKLNIKVDGTP